jgi:hypothetical protein
MGIVTNALTLTLPLLLSGMSPSRADGMIMAPARACTVTAQQRATMLAASYESFDQTMSGDASWRPLVDSGCYDTAAEIVSEYLDTHRRSLTAEQSWTLSFHVGQALAFGGMDARSLAWFEKARDPRATAEWLAYVDATLAFLLKDHKKLIAARAAYLAATGPNAPRLRFIDGMLACATRPYAEAVMCPAGG